MADASDFLHPSLGALLRTSLDAVVVMRVDGTIAGWNEMATKTFGWTWEETRGRRMSELIIPHQHRESHEKGLAHFHATGEGPVLDTHFEITAMKRDGTEIPIELSITCTRQFEEPVFLGFLRDITERHNAQQRQAMLIAELNHRVKNLLAVVAGIAHQTARASPDLGSFRTAFNGRLEALARAHDMLNKSDWEGSDLGTMAEALLGPYADGPGAAARFEGPFVALATRQVISLSMILHELITNATKYGALSRPSGRIALEWAIEGSRDARSVRLSWRESGLSDVSVPERDGFGLKMIALSASHELGGTAQFDWRSEGIELILTFPVRA